MAARVRNRPEGAPPAAVSRIGSTRSRQVPLATLGVLLAAGSALLAVSLYRAGTERVEVVVAARDLDPSRPLSPADLRTTEAATSSDARYLAPSNVTKVLGRPPRGFVPRGTPLNPAMFADTQGLAAGEVVVGAVLEPGAVPTPGLRPGDTVAVVATAKAAAGPALVAQVLGRAAVFGVSGGSGRGGAGSDKVWVSLRVAESLGPQIAQAAQDGTLRLQLVAGP